jgi:S-layer protein
MSVTTAQAISLLEYVLFETKTAATANAASWVSLSNLNSSYSTVSGLAGAMSQTAEAGIAAQVIRYYEGALGRAPAAAEVAYYVNIIENGNAATGIVAMTPTQISEGAVPGATWNTIASFFASSPEFAFASAGSNVVNLLYLNILGRAPNAAEITYYQNLLASGTTVSTLVQYFTTSPEFQTKVNAQIQTGLATYGANVASGGTPAASVVPVLTGGSGTISTNIALTTGVDTPTIAGSTAVNGTYGLATASSTLTAGDQIIGTGSNNVLNVSDLISGGAAQWSPDAIAGVTVSGIQTANFTSGESVLINTATSLEGFTGLTALNVRYVGSGAASSITAGTSTAITATDLTAAGKNVTINGGAAVTLTATGVTTGGTIAIGAGTASTGAVTVTTTELTSETTNTADVIGVTGGTTVAITANLTGAVNNTITGGAITVTGTSATTSVTVTQTAAATAGGKVSGVVDGGVTINDVNAGSATKAGTITSVTLTNYGASTISDNGLTSLTLAGNGGGVTYTDALTTPNTSLTINLNTVKDATGFTDANNELTTVNLVTGGAKASTFAVTDTGLKTVAVSGTQHLTLTGTAPSTLTVSGAAGVTATVAASETFTSTSTGTDVVTIAAAATKTLTGNGTANEELVWNGAVAPAATAYLGTVTGFKVLGIGSAVTAGENFDMTKITGFSGFDVLANTQTGTVQLLNVAAGSPLTIDGAFAGNLVYQTADTAGPTDTVAVTLGAAGNVANFTVAAVILEDNSLNGLGTVSIATNNTTTGVITVSTLQDASLKSLTVTGSSGLTVTNQFQTNVAALSITNNSTGTHGLTFTGGIKDTSLTSLTLAGKGAIALGGITDGTAGITVTGGDANTSFTLLGVTATGKTDSVTLGNGNDTVTDTAAAAGATVNITLGNGNDTVTVGATATNTVTLGTGHDSVIVAAGGSATITFGAHSATAIVDNVTAGAATTATIAPSAIITGMNVSGVDTITFSGDAGATAAITAVTAAQLNSWGGNPTTLAGAVAGVLAAGGGNLAQHHIAEFQFQGNTYFLEQAGATGAAFAAGDTVVELTGLQTFTAAGTIAAAGVLTLHG